MSRAKFNRHALWLAIFTVVYNLIEGIVSVYFGGSTDSSALVGFGLDSFMESLSGLIMLWRFSAHPDLSEHEVELREFRAITLVSITFFLLGGYTLYSSIDSLAERSAPDPKIWGILIAVVSLIVMPVLFWLKRKVATGIGSLSLHADSKQTLACMFLSLALLLGVGANTLFGYWWADPIAGVIIGLYLIYEGYRTFRQRELCAC